MKQIPHYEIDMLCDAVLKIFEEDFQLFNNIHMIETGQSKMLMCNVFSPSHPRCLMMFAST